MWWNIFETSVVFEINCCLFDNWISVFKLYDQKSTFFSVIVIAFNLVATWLIVGRLSGSLLQQTKKKCKL